MQELPVRQGVVLALALVAFAAAMALWLGVFRQEQAAAALEPDLVVSITADPGVGTPIPNGSVVRYEIVASNITDAGASNVAIDFWVAGGNPTVQSISAGGTCISFGGIDACTADIAGNSSVTLLVDVEVTAAAGSSVEFGAYVDPPTDVDPFGAERESEFGRRDYGDDEALECGHVGEGEDLSLTFDGVQLEPDNYDCTKHDVVEGAAPTPSPTPPPAAGVLRNCPLPGKWAISVWDGPSGTATADALATCGDVSINAAYSLDRTTNAWSRYFPGRTDVSNLLSVEDMQGIITLGQ
jgi:hypothetical protein